MVIPRDLPEQLQRENEIDIPIQYNSVDEPSQITYLRLKELVDRWRQSIVDRPAQARPEDQELRRADPGEGAGRGHRARSGGSVWSRLFPFLLVMMSLTGAFYPAIDLCAGEKERGTMETLLISPASRSEIVLGKFLTVMLASVMTAILNLVSMGLTGVQLARQVGALSAEPEPVGRPRLGVLAPPTLQAAFWMVAALDPPGGLFQRGLRGPGRAGAEHERGPVLHDAALSHLHAAGLPDADAGNRARSLLQPGPDHGGRPALEGLDPGKL